MTSKEGMSETADPVYSMVKVIHEGYPFQDDPKSRGLVWSSVADNFAATANYNPLGDIECELRSQGIPVWFVSVPLTRNPHRRTAFTGSDGNVYKREYTASVSLKGGREMSCKRYVRVIADQAEAEALLFTLHPRTADLQKIYQKNIKLLQKSGRLHCRIIKK